MDRIDMMKAFITVVTEGSFIKAAERLDCSPQLVSKYVAQLESHLGSRLLNRTTRRLSVTEAGSIYFQRAQQVLTDIDEMEHELGDLQHAARGRLRINAHRSPLPSIICPAHWLSFSRIIRKSALTCS